MNVQTSESLIPAVSALVLGFLVGCQANLAVMPDGTRVYVVQRGDSLNSIAAANGTTTSELMFANKLKKPALRIGQRLVLPQETFSFQRFMDSIASRMPFEEYVKTEKVQSAARRHPAGDLSFSVPMEDEVLTSPLQRDELVGKWFAQYYACEREFFSDAQTKWYVAKATESFEFRNDGRYSMRLDVNGKLFKTGTGTWEYDNGSLIFKCDDNKNREGRYRVDCFNENEIAVRCRDNEEGRRMVLERFAARYPRGQYQNVVEFWYDKKGCQHIVRKHSSAVRGVLGEAIETPHRLVRVGHSGIQVARPIEKGKDLYQIISCERETGSDFSYKFVLKLIDKSNLRTFRTVQQEFRAAVKSDYIESFPGVKRDSLFVDFPEYKLNKGNIEGRAVVLTISVTSLAYDPNTRTGKLAVKVNANQYEEARKWIRRNIETLARDKNIALTTGQLPPAAKFYLGREELKDGNILEIGFKTE